MSTGSSHHFMCQTVGSCRGRHTEAASLCRAAAQHCPASVKLYLGSFEDTVPTTPVVPSAPALAEELEVRCNSVHAEVSSMFIAQQQEVSVM